ncbi:glycosyltransferase 1 domain-containing protein 1-like [Dendronephthya gigantea]|uniref:glycosyltransferase 1 domain-containing protein 1-like n=1 Tax=Dendronephthya gigantea TaxID=151771 RepID=UPI00106C752D|nr:glycosyltransferase 1 domain-containing protein 1-like [Dendronephthya gigantea]
MAKILLLARLTPQSGNLTTAERIKGHLEASGHTCELQNTDSFDGVDRDFNQFVVKSEFNCIIGIHLWRAGKLLLDCSKPFSMIFGGTDINLHVQDSKKLDVMTKVVENATNLVVFSQRMALKAEAFWPNIKSKLVIQPQAIFTCPSKNFTERDMIDKMRACTTVSASCLRNDSGTLIIFLLVAGLRPVKDPTFLFKAMSDWHKEDSRVLLVVVGPEIDVAFAKDVKEMAKRYPGVVILQALSQPDLHAAIKYSATAVVNTSISEGMAASILEAMDLDTVVLARKVPGNESVIKHNENGLLFETPEEFITFAKQVAFDGKYRDRLTMGGKEYISNNHSLAVERETYNYLVRTLMA